LDVHTADHLGVHNADYCKNGLLEFFGDCKQIYSKLRTGFVPRSFCVEFTVNQMAVGLVPRTVLRFVLATIISPSLLNLTVLSTVFVEKQIDSQLV
jgi:hypothetical protein